MSISATDVTIPLNENNSEWISNQSPTKVLTDSLMSRSQILVGLGISALLNAGQLEEKSVKAVDKRLESRAGINCETNKRDYTSN